MRPEETIAGGNASLTFMHQYVLHAWLNGPLGPETAWRREPGPLKFLCVVPGYDRHFTITESLGFELVNVPLTGGGPDMDRVEALVADDPRIKGIWCVPKYSNPTGDVYSDEVVERLAHLARRAGPHFRILWDNAYAVHDFDDDPPVLANLMERCRAAGTEDSVVLFGSTSKITRAGSRRGVHGGLGRPTSRRSAAASSGCRRSAPTRSTNSATSASCGTANGIRAHMRRQAAIVRPKFERVLHHLEAGLATDGLASWSRPRGGYFLSVDAPEGLAAEIVRLAGEAGVKLTPAGATFPHGRDPRDSNIRLAPTYPSLDEIDRAMPVFVTAVALAAARQQLQQGAVHA